MKSGVIPSRFAAFTFGPGRNQELCRLHFVAVNSPVQRGGAIDLGGVDVRLFRKQAARGCRVALHDGVGDVAAGARCDCSPTHHQEGGASCNLAAIHRDIVTPGTFGWRPVAGGSRLGVGVRAQGFRLEAWPNLNPKP